MRTIPPVFAVSHLRGFTVKSVSEVKLDGTEKDALVGLSLALCTLPCDFAHRPTNVCCRGVKTQSAGDTFCLL